MTAMQEVRQQSSWIRSALLQGSLISGEKYKIDDFYDNFNFMENGTESHFRQQLQSMGVKEN